MFDFTKIKKQIAEVEAWLTKEFSGIRTNRATPAFLDGIKVDSYGSLMSINQIAAISVEDARSLRIAPWDHSQGKTIEKAITAANLGVSVSADDKGVRVTFPELSAERREQIIKLAKAKLEDARKSLRANRDEVVRELQGKEKEGGLGKDDIFRLKGDVQKLVDAGNKKLEEMLGKKEQEISS
ncbi:MAG: ribosome-recycling factor [Candidatus Paceibacterota bacterium]|jgi:ribosome recycling factor